MVSERFDEAYVPDVVPESDLEYFDRGGHGTRGGWGDSPAVLVVDETEEFTGERPEEGDRCVEATRRVLDAARAAGYPVVFTKPDQELQRFTRGTTKEKAEDAPGREGENVVDGRLDRQPDEYVLEKPRASAFFDTHLSNMFREWDVDTLVVTGITTSGCVRATVVDGHSNNFDVVVVEEGVADRSVISHQVSLLDMDMKYADVTPVDDVVSELEGLEDQLAEAGRAD